MSDSVRTSSNHSGSVISGTLSANDAAIQEALEQRAREKKEYMDALIKEVLVRLGQRWTDQNPGTLKKALDETIKDIEQDWSESLSGTLEDPSHMVESTRINQEIKQRVRNRIEAERAQRDLEIGQEEEEIEA